MPGSVDQQKILLSEVIKKQIAILGPSIALGRARNVKGLTVADDGSITDMEGDPEELTKQLVNQFLDLSGLIIKKMMEPLMDTATTAIPTTPMPQYVPKI
jgi:hypothetical protein